MNISGRICSDNWDDKDATVVCRELGWGQGQLFVGTGKAGGHFGGNIRGAEFTYTGVKPYVLSVRD
jgi:hypothetical protein